MTCTVVQELEQPHLYELVSREIRAGHAVAVLDPTWPERFLTKAVDQVEAAASCGSVGPGEVVLFSSGSTGQPRGIVRTVESWQASVGPLSAITGITREDRVWLPGPLWSSLFLYGAFHAGAVGAQVILGDDHSDESAGATVLHCVPTQLPGLLERAEAGGLPLVRCVVVAGDHCPAALRVRCVAAGWHLVEYYGAVELSFVAWRDSAGPYRAFPGVQTELREGVLWVRSPYLAKGYLAAATVPLTRSTPSPGSRAPSLNVLEPTRTVPGLAEAGPFVVDQHGWATVSDLAREADGGLEVLGRGESAVTSGGHTVVVEEVERLLREIPGVQEAAVLGMPHPRLGQVLAAVVVGPAVDATLREAFSTMPAPSRPRRWLHADSLPRTSGGKLRRDALPDLVASLSSQRMVRL